MLSVILTVSWEVSYPGAGHAFFWPGTPAFNAEARNDAWARILDLLAS